MLPKLVNSVLASRRWLWLVILANIAGFFFGIWFYWQQLSITPSLLWLFVIDCPLYVLLASVVLVGHDKKWNVPSWFTFVVTVGLFKYAIWTFYALLVYWKYFFFDLAPIWNYTYAPAHVFMFLEGFLIFKLVKEFKWQYIAIAAAWFWLNDFIDYWLGTYPIVPAGHVFELRNLMIAASIAVPVLIYAWRNHLKAYMETA
ncbi:MAG: DUF1405 domain-containing protein [DPANN group archaeon]|nr:DUF1405 domain-containing protein [DPANN group archaeon]